MLVMFSAIIAEAFKIIVRYNFGDPLDYEPFNDLEMCWRKVKFVKYILTLCHIWKTECQKWNKVIRSSSFIDVFVDLSNLKFFKVSGLY